LVRHRRPQSMEVKVLVKNLLASAIAYIHPR
jgi:hypothetical protein